MLSSVMPPEASSGKRPPNHGDGLAHIGNIHVVEQHRVGKAHGENIAQLVEASTSISILTDGRHSHARAQARSECRPRRQCDCP